MDKLKKLLLCGGLDKETFKKIRSFAQSENQRSVNAFTIVGAACFTVTLFATIFGANEAPTAVYGAGAGLFVLMHILNRLLSKKWPLISDILAILYSAGLLIAGVFIAYGQSTERTTILLPLFTLVSLVFCYRPVYLLAILSGTEIGYLVIMKNIQTESLFFVNSINTMIFCLVGLACGFYTLAMKFKKYEAEYNNQILIEKDVLTGVNNRYSCARDSAEIDSERKPVVVCVFDVNGLKAANDSKGHLAGDELIKAAANCIDSVFGPYGKVYRTGGDEFCALLHSEFDEEKLRSEFSEIISAWKGELVDELSISLGIAKFDPSTEGSIEEAVHAADVQMYDQKREHYITHNRRMR